LKIKIKRREGDIHSEDCLPQYTQIAWNDKQNGHSRPNNIIKRKDQIDNPNTNNDVTSISKM